jgi:hypothetical protein
MCGPEGRVAEEAPSRDALRGMLRDDARVLDCALPAPRNGNRHEAHSHAGFNG